MRKVLFAAAVVVLVWACVVVPLPLASLEPVPALQVADLVELQDGSDARLPDELRVTAVELRRATTVEALRVLADEHRELTLAHAVVPAGIDEERFTEFQQRLFRESIQVAVVAGLRAAGRDVSVSGAGARVIVTFPGTPADAVLQQEDVIVAVDDRSIELASELRAVLSGREPGEEVTVTLRRDGEELTESLRLVPGSTGGDGAGLGVMTATVDLEVESPFEVRARPEAGVGGSSAGLMVALGTYAVASGDVPGGGRVIAGTGAVDAVGDVQPVAAIEAKVRGAELAGAEVFLVPASLAERARAAAPSGLRIVPVASVADAIEALTG